MTAPGWLNTLTRRVVQTLIGTFLVLSFLADVPEADAQVPANAAKYKKQAIAEYRAVFGLNGPVAALAAQVEAESAWNEKATSRVGARGMTQFMGGTAADIQKKYAKQFLGVSQYSPLWSFRAQALYMRDLRAAIKADNECERFAFALSAYNGGLGYVYRRQKKSTKPGVCLGATCSINPGILPSNQTENETYPAKILSRFEVRYIAALWGAGICH